MLKLVAELTRLRGRGIAAVDRHKRLELPMLGDLISRHDDLVGRSRARSLKALIAESLVLLQDLDQPVARRVRLLFGLGANSTATPTELRSIASQQLGEVFLVSRTRLRRDQAAFMRLAEVLTSVPGDSLVVRQPLRVAGLHALRQGNALALHGDRGTGKTALARMLCAELGGSWIELSGGSRSNLLRDISILRARLADITTTDPFMWLGTALGSRRGDVFLLDDVKDQELLNEVLPGQIVAQLILTSNEQLEVPFSSQQVGPMSVDEAEKMASRRLHNQSPAAVSALTRACHEWPLAITHACAVVARGLLSVDEVVRLLESSPGRALASIAGRTSLPSLYATTVGRLARDELDGSSALLLLDIIVLAGPKSLTINELKALFVRSCLGGLDDFVSAYLRLASLSLLSQVEQVVDMHPLTAHVLLELQAGRDTSVAQDALLSDSIDAAVPFDEAYRLARRQWTAMRMLNGRRRLPSDQVLAILTTLWLGGVSEDVLLAVAGRLGLRFTGFLDGHLVPTDAGLYLFLLRLALRDRVGMDLDDARAALARLMPHITGHPLSLAHFDHVSFVLYPIYGETWNEAPPPALERRVPLRRITPERWATPEQHLLSDVLGLLGPDPDPESSGLLSQLHVILRCEQALETVAPEAIEFLLEDKFNSYGLSGSWIAHERYNTLFMARQIHSASIYFCRVGSLSAEVRSQLRQWENQLAIITTEPDGVGGDYRLALMRLLLLRLRVVLDGPAEALNAFTHLSHAESQLDWAYLTGEEATGSAGTLWGIRLAFAVLKLRYVCGEGNSAANLRCGERLADIAWQQFRSGTEYGEVELLRWLCSSNRGNDSIPDDLIVGLDRARRSRRTCETLNGLARAGKSQQFAAVLLLR